MKWRVSEEELLKACRVAEGLGAFAFNKRTLLGNDLARDLRDARARIADLERENVGLRREVEIQKRVIAR